LNHERVITERLEYLSQPVGHPRGVDDAFDFRLEHFGRDGCVPVLFQGNRLFEIGPNLLCQDIPRNPFFERTSRTNLMGVIDALDRFLRLDALFEGQFAGQTRRGAEQGESCKNH